MQEETSCGSGECCTGLFLRRVTISHLDQTLDFAAMVWQACQLSLPAWPETLGDDEANAVVHDTGIVEDTPVSQGPLSEVISTQQPSAKTRGIGSNNVQIAREITYIRARSDDVKVEVAERRSASTRG